MNQQVTYQPRGLNDLMMSYSDSPEKCGLFWDSYSVSHAYASSEVAGYVVITVGQMISFFLRGRSNIIIHTEWISCSYLKKYTNIIMNADHLCQAFPSVFHIFLYVVSGNTGTPKSCILIAPKSSILIGCSLINHLFWGTPNLGTPIPIFCSSWSETSWWDPTTIFGHYFVEDMYPTEN